MTIVALTMMATFPATACSSEASTTGGRVLAPGEPDVALPDPASLPLPPSPGSDAGVPAADEALRLAH